MRPLFLICSVLLATACDRKKDSDTRGAQIESDKGNTDKKLTMVAPPGHGLDIPGDYLHLPTYQAAGDPEDVKPPRKEWPKPEVIRRPKRPTPAHIKPIFNDLDAMNSADTETETEWQPLNCGTEAALFENVELRSGLRLMHGYHEHVTPWQVLLRRTTEPEPVHCGSVVVPMQMIEHQSKILVTAASCVTKIKTDGTVEKLEATEFEATAGAYHLRWDAPGQQRQIHGIEEIRVYDSYAGDPRHHNVAVLKANTSFVFGETVRPICLPERDAEPPTGATCTVSGWGYVSPHEPVAQRLRALDMKLHDKQSCIDSWGNVFRSHEMVCAGDVTGKNRTCARDNGGALVCPVGDLVAMIGLISNVHLPQCPDPLGKPALFPLISHYRKWIDDTIHELLHGQ